MSPGATLSRERDRPGKQSGQKLSDPRKKTRCRTNIAIEITYVAIHQIRPD